MADGEQVRILQQGVAAWNRWRGQNPNAHIDLTGADLGRVELAGGIFHLSGYLTKSAPD